MYVRTQIYGAHPPYCTDAMFGQQQHPGKGRLLRRGKAH